MGVCPGLIAIPCSSHWLTLNPLCTLRTSFNARLKCLRKSRVRVYSLPNCSANYSHVMWVVFCTYAVRCANHTYMSTLNPPPPCRRSAARWRISTGIAVSIMES